MSFVSNYLKLTNFLALAMRKCLPMWFFLEILLLNMKNKNASQVHLLPNTKNKTASQVQTSNEGCLN